MEKGGHTDKNNLYTIRCLLNLTTENMGNDLGVTRQTVSNLEKGRVPFGKIYKLALGYLIEHEYAGKVSKERLNLIWELWSEL